MTHITTGRTHARRVENARYAPRTFGGQFMPRLEADDFPNSYYWQQQHKTALASRPADLRGDLWNTLVDLIWPGDEKMTWKEATLKINKAVELWNTGVRDLAALAAQINAAIDPQPA